MKKEEIHFGDLNRWLFGQTPPEFMIEVLLRTLIIFVILIIIVRLMGKRMSGQLSLTELAVMITLGAIVSPVMQLPDRGILFGIVALLVALIFQRGLNWLGFKNKKIEAITQGSMSLLVKDGVLNLTEMDKTNISRQQLFAMLREKKVQNLAKVERAYLEGCGILSVYQSENVRPGLPLFPATDTNIRTIQFAIEDEHTKACCSCGSIQRIEKEDEQCKLCGSKDWSIAYLSIK